MNQLQENPSLDVIIVTLSRWDNPYSSTALSMARELSRKRRVFFVDNPFTFKDLIFKYRHGQIRRREEAWLYQRNVYTPIGGLDQNLIALTLPFVLPINFLPEGKLYSFLASINDRIVFSSIKKMMSKFRITDFIFLIIFNPSFMSITPWMTLLNRAMFKSMAPDWKERP